MGCSVKKLSSHILVDGILVTRNYEKCNWNNVH